MVRRSQVLLSMLGAGLVGLLLLAPPCRPAGAAPSAIHLLEIDGVINPLTARYLDRGIEAARRAGAQAIIVELDTPGGTMAATRQMVTTLLGAPVPVVVYVAPAGARAASAGVFITAAASVAAMAPATHLGSAHPVALGGAKPNTTIEEKVVHDAAALARAIAAERSRNPTWLEQAVRESVSATATEAKRLGVIDLTAASRGELLAALDGRTVATSAGPRTLATARAAIEPRPMNLAERILHAITDPNIAYALFSLGLLGIAAELYHPGLIFSGVIGATCVILALVAFGNLPINWGGVALLVLGIALVVLDAFSAGVGVLTVLGAITLLLGSLFFYRPLHPRSPTLPDVSLSPWLVGGSFVVVLGFSAIVLRALWRLRRQPTRSGPEALVGRHGVATSHLAPRGQVRLAGELWSAVAANGDILPGQSVRVLGVDGVTLRVFKDEEAAR